MDDASPDLATMVSELAQRHGLEPARAPGGQYLFAPTDDPDLVVAVEEVEDGAGNSPPGGQRVILLQSVIGHLRGPDDMRLLRAALVANLALETQLGPVLTLNTERNALVAVRALHRAAPGAGVVDALVLEAALFAMGRSAAVLRTALDTGDLRALEPEVAASDNNESEMTFRL